MLSNRSFWLGALVLAGCYKPTLSSPGFFCHETDDPPCPDGQQCVSGRCTAPGGMHSIMFNDMGSTSHHDGGAPADLADSASMPDLARTSAADLAMPPSTLTGCAGLITCINACPATDMNCPMACQTNTTTQGNTLFNSLINCIVQQCPTTSPTDPCYNTSSTTCTNCFSSAQQGACSSQVTACDNDPP